LPGLRRIEVSFATQHTRDHAGDLWESASSGTVAMRFVRNTSIAGRYSYGSEVFLGREFSTTGVSASLASQVTRQLNLRATFADRDAIYYAGDPFGGRSRNVTFGAVYLPTDNLHTELTLTYADFDRASDGTRLYDYGIARSRTTYQVNRYLFFRGIFEYNSFRRQLTSDLLASFTYVPGTVLHLGYGSLYVRIRWEDCFYTRSDRFLESRRGLFCKASYLWRM
jgi:hypothetical protein